MKFCIVKNGIVTQTVGAEQLDWDSTHSCSASALTQAEQIAFGVFPITPSPQPTFDDMSQNCIEDIPILIGNTWTQQWTVSQASTSEIQNRAIIKVQDYMTQQAQISGYDDLVSACSYTGAPNPFQVESQSFVTWRGNCWQTCHTILAAVQAGTQPIPTAAQLIAALPVRV